jgi:hypothetical protein
VRCRLNAVISVVGTFDGLAVAVVGMDEMHDFAIDVFEGDENTALEAVVEFWKTGFRFD